MFMKVDKNNFGNYYKSKGVAFLEQ